MMLCSLGSHALIGCFHLFLILTWPKKSTRLNYILLRFSLKKSSVKIYSIITWISRHESNWGTDCPLQKVFTLKRDCGWRREEGGREGLSSWSLWGRWPVGGCGSLGLCIWSGFAADKPGVVCDKAASLPTLSQDKWVKR